MNILVVNAGSSSHKMSFYSLKDESPVEPLWEGSIDWGRTSAPISVKAESHEGTKLEQEFEERDLPGAIHALIGSLVQGPVQVIQSLSDVHGVGHRVVHGGVKFERPVLINPEVTAKIRELFPLAPLHNPANLQGIEMMQGMFPDVPHVAVFDTSFHLTMPDFIKTYPCPWDWKEKGVQRFGFHGISHQYCAGQASRMLDTDQLKMINCHLGNGCSLCAIKDGKSYETTMGLTPLEGLMMGTRSGSVDPGILLFLMREYQMTVDEVDHALNYESGLIGIGGLSDMRELLALQGNEKAEMAVQMFVHRLKGFIGAMAASLGGVHVLSFTAGIGENAPSIREEVCRGLSFLGIEIDSVANEKGRPDLEISSSSSSVRVLVLQTKEDWMIARASFELIGLC